VPRTRSTGARIRRAALAATALVVCGAVATPTVAAPAKRGKSKISTTGKSGKRANHVSRDAAASGAVTIVSARDVASPLGTMRIMTRSDGQVCLLGPWRPLYGRDGRVIHQHSGRGLKCGTPAEAARGDIWLGEGRDIGDPVDLFGYLPGATSATVYVRNQVYTVPVVDGVWTIAGAPSAYVGVGHPPTG
jgi:hypothetical protein